MLNLNAIENKIAHYMIFESNVPTDKKQLTLIAIEICGNIEKIF